MLQWTWLFRHLLEIETLFPSDMYPEVGLLNYMVVLILIFWGLSILLSIVSASTYIPANSACAVLHLVAQSCPTLCDPMDCSPPSSSVHGGYPGKNTGVGMPSFKGSSQPRDRPQVSHIADGFFTIWATREAQQCTRVPFFLHPSQHLFSFWS